ncbi:MAG: hypothetical protein OHK0022_23630 [Roseiflexaceae bacterium]
MELFILFRPCFNQKTTQLSFLATPSSSQGISAGTPDMIRQMLSDLGFGQTDYQRWSLAHMVSNYLADDPEANDWRDVWRDTWEITVELGQLAPPARSPQQLVRTYAYDETWHSPGLEARPILPAPAVLIADFYTRTDLQQAEELFAAVGRLRSDGHAIKDIGQLLSHSAPVVLDDVVRTFQQSTRFTGTVHTRRREGNNWPYQLLVALDPADQKVLEAVPSPMELLNDLCYELGATTAWDELQRVMLKLDNVQKRFGTASFTVADAADVMRLDLDRVERYLQGWSEYPQSQLQHIGTNADQEAQYAFVLRPPAHNG